MEVYDYNKTDKHHVQVDADLEDIIPGYLANRLRDVELIHKALEAGDYAAINISGHSMKGSGGGYGFNAITEFGDQLEYGAKNRDDAIIVEALDNLRDYVENLVVEYVEEGS